MEYLETFDDGTGGWLGWGFQGGQALELHNGAVSSRSPWWVDFNHAPPGAGYLHLLFCLHTSADAYTEAMQQLGGENHFIKGRYPTDFKHAAITVRMRGQLELKGAQVVLLAQSQFPGGRVNQVLTGQPITVGHEWSEHTLHLVPDESQWCQLGSRHDRSAIHDTNPHVAYREAAIAEVLRDVNCDIIFVLFPLDVTPLEDNVEEPHLLRAGEDYPLNLSRLPAGHVEMDAIRIQFAQPA